MTAWGGYMTATNELYKSGLSRMLGTESEETGLGRECVMKCRDSMKSYVQAFPSRWE